MAATDPPADLQLAPLRGEPRAVSEWLTTFHLCLVALDPFTNESAWILDTAGRLLSTYTAADVRVGWLVTGTPEEATEFLGPWADRLLTFADPDREVVKSLGLEELPALVHLNVSGAVEGSAEGWRPEGWRSVLDNLSRLLSWTRPAIPAPGDPAAFHGTSALG
ncbi:MAG: hypothetical protein ACRD0G_19580 [Acidimicrobiales bacterium]